MEPKEAVAAAKKHLSEIFADELKEQPTLEEIWFDETRNEWCVTLGLLDAHMAHRDPLGLKSRMRYKTVRVSDGSGKAVSIKNRAWAEPALES